MVLDYLACFDAGHFFETGFADNHSVGPFWNECSFR